MQTDQHGDDGVECIVYLLNWRLQGPHFEEHRNIKMMFKDEWVKIIACIGIFCIYTIPSIDFKPKQEH